MRRSQLWFYLVVMCFDCWFFVYLLLQDLQKKFVSKTGKTGSVERVGTEAGSDGKDTANKHSTRKELHTFIFRASLFSHAMLTEQSSYSAKRETSSVGGTRVFLSFQGQGHHFRVSNVFPLRAEIAKKTKTKKNQKKAM